MTPDSPGPDAESQLLQLYTIRPPAPRRQPRNSLSRSLSAPSTHSQTLCGLENKSARGEYLYSIIKASSRSKPPPLISDPQHAQRTTHNGNISCQLCNSTNSRDVRPAVSGIRLGSRSRDTLYKFTLQKKTHTSRMGSPRPLPKPGHRPPRRNSQLLLHRDSCCGLQIDLSQVAR